MAQYRPGVLIHNYNEDLFGAEQALQPKPASEIPQSITSTAFCDPKSREDLMQPNMKHADDGPQPKPAATQCIPDHLLFGHAGNPNNTKNLETKEFVSTSQYFYQAPKIAEAKKIDVEDFYEGKGIAFTQLTKTGTEKYNSTIASGMKEGWKWDKNPFTSTYGQNIGAKNMDSSEGIT